MKFDRMKLAPVALALALGACGGGTEDGNDSIAAEATEALPSETPVAEPTGATATPEATESVAASETPSPTPSTAKSPTPAAKPTTTAAVPASPPAAFAQCSVCHSVEPGDNGIGPSLAGVYGTKAAAVPGFKFSPAMQASGLTWDAATLDTYLKDPRKVVPGTTMGFGGVKDDAKRKAIIDFLKVIG